MAEKPVKQAKPTVAQAYNARGEVVTAAAEVIERGLADGRYTKTPPAEGPKKK